MTIESIGERMRRSLVVMFADIEQSTANISSLDPEEARDLLGPAVDHMRRLVHLYDGVVVRTQGDGILALFGLTQLDEEHALNAILAGRAIADFYTQSDMRKSVLSVRVGIHAGNVLLHKTKNDFGQNLDVTGHPVHIAAKVEQACPSNTVLVTSDALSLVNLDVVAVPVVLESTSHPLHAFNLFELKSVAPELPSTLRAENILESGLIGRDRELSESVDWLNTQASRGGILILQGRAGIGKSRLSSSIAKIFKEQGGRIFVVRALKSRSTRSFGAFSKAISGVLGVPEGARMGDVSMALERVNVPLSYLDAILDLIGSSDITSKHQRKEPQVKKRAIQEAISIVFMRVFDDQNLICLIEDLHYLDDASLEAVRILLLELETIGARFVATTRRSKRGWTHPVREHCILLTELRRDDAILLIRRLISDQNLNFSDPQIEHLYSVTSGVPFYIQTYCQALTEGASVSTGNVPLRIEVLMQGQIDSLSSAARDLLYFLSISGGGLEEFICAELSATNSDFMDGLRELQQLELAISDTDGLISLSHELLAEVCRKQLLRADRVSRNAQIYEMLLKHRDATSISDRLAHHAANAGQLDDSLTHYWEACGREVRRANITAITELYSKAMLVCDEIGTEADMRRAEFTLLTFDSFYQMGALDGLLERVSAAAAISQANENALCEAQAWAHIATLEWMSGRHENAHRAASTAFDLSSRESITPLMVYAWFSIANSLHGQGKLREAINKMDGLLEFLSGELLNMPSGTAGMPSVLARALQIWFLSQTGEFQRARELEKEAYALASRSTQNYAMINTDAASGLMHQAIGSFSTALEKFQTSYDNCIEQEMMAMAPRTAAGIGQCLTRLGNAPEAHDFLKSCLNDRVQRFGGRYNWVYLHVALAEACQLSGYFTEAKDAAELALQFAEENQEPTSICVSRLTLGDICLMSGDHIGAKAHYEKAEILAETIEMRSARCFAVAGRALASALGGSSVSTEHSKRVLASATMPEYALARFELALRAIDKDQSFVWLHGAV